MRLGRKSLNCMKTWLTGRIGETLAPVQPVTDREPGWEDSRGMRGSPRGEQVTLKAGAGSGPQAGRSDWRRVASEGGDWEACGFRGGICTGKSLPLWPQADSRWGECAPAELGLTDLENAMQVTARSKNPAPMTCRVLSVTESQMRTWGGNCCGGKTAKSLFVRVTRIYRYPEATR